MSKDSGLAWAQKMAGVLGTGTGRSAVAPTNGSPAPTAAPAPGGGDGSAAPGSPTKAGTPSKQGDGAPTAGTAPGAPTAPKDSPTGTAQGTGGGAAGGTTAGGGAQGGGAAAPGAPAPQSIADKKVEGYDFGGNLRDIEAALAEAKRLEGELKKLAQDCQVVKKSIDDAGRQASAAEKSLPPVPQVGAPQGKDAKAQYDSAIQITGNIRKVQQDAAAKIGSVREQQEIAEVQNSDLEPLYLQSTSKAVWVNESVETAKSSLETAGSTVKVTLESAAEFKKKYRALKDDHPDRAGLKEIHLAYVKSAQWGSEVLAKVQATYSQFPVIAKSAATLTQNIERLNAESQTAREAMKQQVASVDGKLAPYDDAVTKSEVQESEYQSKLSEGDAEAVLKARYEALGGDEELRKALADEDKEFVTEAEKFRASLEDWKKDAIRELEEYKASANLDARLADFEAMKEWYAKENASLNEVTQDAQKSLGGDKQATEPVKGVMVEIRKNEREIKAVKEKILNHVTNAMVEESLKFRLDMINTNYKVSEKYLKERQVELNNQLQMDGMSLERKVDFLQTRPKPVRDQIQKKLEGELYRIRKLSVADTKRGSLPPIPKEPTPVPKPLDWSWIKDKIAKYKDMDVSALKEIDKKILDEIQKTYTDAGGDNALMEKLVAEWKQKVENVERDEAKLGSDYRRRSEKLRGDLDTANKNHQEMVNQVAMLKEDIASKQLRLGELDSFADPSVQVKAQRDLLEAELKRLKTNEKNLELKAEAAALAKENARMLELRERNRYEATAKNIHADVQKPTWEDIQKMTLRDKAWKLSHK